MPEHLSRAFQDMKLFGLEGADHVSFAAINESELGHAVYFTNPM